MIFMVIFVLKLLHLLKLWQISVFVAQERKNICVWYNVEDPDKMKITLVKGDVEEIRKKEGKTEVILKKLVLEIIMVKFKLIY